MLSLLRSRDVQTAAIVIALILQRPLCRPCIAEKAGVNDEALRPALDTG